MRYLVVFFLLLLGYTFIYTGLSKLWKGVTFFENPVKAGIANG